MGAFPHIWCRANNKRGDFLVSKIETLLTLQDVDLQIRDIEKELEDIPARQKLEESRLQEHREALGAAEDKHKAAQAAVQQLELEAESIQERIRKLRQQQVELKTNKEFKTMEHEIEMAQKDILLLEDKELVLMEGVETSRLIVKESSADLKDEEEAVAEDVKALDGRAGELKDELGALKAERDKAAGEVDASWLQHYERLLSRRKDRVVVPLQEGICGGCHMKLPPSVLHNTHRKTDMVVCEYCGRLLYS